jgi:hypothetical protein
VEKAPLTAKQLNDSAPAGHACFADSTDVFGIHAVSGGLYDESKPGGKGRFRP